MGSQKEILLVEDNCYLLEFAGEILINSGHQVFAATSAEKALQFLENDIHFDLILSDIQLPGEMNGIELAQKAMQRRPNIKVLLTSGHFDTFEASIDEGGFPFIEKPYRMGTLNEAVHAVLQAAI